MRPLILSVLMALVSLAFLIIFAIEGSTLTTILWGVGFGGWCANVVMDLVLWQERRP